MLFEATDTKNANEDFYGRNQSKFSHMHSFTLREMKTLRCAHSAARRTIKSQPKKVPSHSLGRCLANFIHLTSNVSLEVFVTFSDHCNME